MEEENKEDMDNNENRAVPITVSVPYDMAKWLDRHKKEINRSKIFQEAIQKIQNPSKYKLSPFLGLTIVLSLTFGICLLLASTQTDIFGFFTSTVLILLGIFVIFTSIITLYKEVRNNARGNR